jgi:hypothetical protein
MNNKILATLIAERHIIAEHALKFHRMLLMSQLQGIQRELARRNLAANCPWFFDWLEKEVGG